MGNVSDTLRNPASAGATAFEGGIPMTLRSRLETAGDSMMHGQGQMA